MEFMPRPVWSALKTGWSHWAEGDAQALRLRRELGMFGAAADGSESALAGLRAMAADLPDDDPEIWLVEVDPPEPPGCLTVRTASCVQMIAEAIAPGPATDLPVEVLGEADAAEMLALAVLTKPGPYRLGTHRLGRFIGVREEGRLIAMAGERMRMPGMAEVSAVCTHPDARGRGLATVLMRLVAERMVARGERPFLHAYAENEGAIALYRRLGFQVAGAVGVRVITAVRS